MPKSPDNFQEQRSAVAKACCAVLFKADISREGGGLQILRNTLNHLVWKYSEATPNGGGKYTSCQWWSVDALKEYRSNRREYYKEVHLEHVVPRKYLVDQLLAAKDAAGVQAVLDAIETCVVLRKEHDDLAKEPEWLPDPARPGG